RAAVRGDPSIADARGRGDAGGRLGAGDARASRPGRASRRTRRSAARTRRLAATTTRAGPDRGLVPCARPPSARPGVLSRLVAPDRRRPGRGLMEGVAREVILTRIRDALADSPTP